MDMKLDQLFISTFCVYIVLISCHQTYGKDVKSPTDLLVVTVASEQSDGFRRFMRSAKKYNHSVEVLGMGQKWKGGDMDMPGGGYKVNLLKQAMEKYQELSNMLVMFVDSYDLVLSAEPKAIMDSFSKFDSKVIFSAEGFCWPDGNLKSKYPEVKANENRFLNSGGFLGYAPQIYQIVSSKAIANADDDQLFYTKVFLDESQRKKYSIKLDTRGDIFQNLHGALEEVKLEFKGSQSYLYNSRTGNAPLVVHGNGPIKPQFNRLADYLADQWTPTAGCQACEEDTISLQGVSKEDYPRMMIGVFFDKPTPFADVFFKQLNALDYPKEKLDLFLYYASTFHDKDFENFMDQHGVKYNSVKFLRPEEELGPREARNMALDECLKADCQYYFHIDSEAHLEDNNTLVSLIEQNRSVIIPYLGRPGKMWSNFWGALSPDGFYKRADDYVDIVNFKRMGLWNVPYINNCYMIHAARIPEIVGAYTDTSVDADMAFCQTLRNKGIFMYLTNMRYYGHLVSTDEFPTTHLYNDLYQIFENKYTWEKKYLSPKFREVLEEDFTAEQPCPDVYWFPLMNEAFCHDLVGEMENLNEWSAGKNEDSRLTGGYENVPTVDTHTNQIGWERHWLQILKDYVAPLNAKVFPGYFTESKAIMNFVVRYRKGEQDRLRPHHDSSTYTINMALNRPKIDYQGAGCRFLRYNCTVSDLRQGWILMHPGRLTHYHEGLPTTGGTRYIMISFIDP